jgi:hypothetical protein
VRVRDKISITPTTILGKYCIEIWQKATIREALPDEYKDKLRQELGTKGKESQLEQAGSQQSTEFAPSDESSNISPDSPRANSSSVGPVEDVSEDFSQMNRGTDVITEK